jgi:hypothetical protein
VDVNPPAGSKADLKIASPTAVASVRGTSFDLDIRNLRVDSGTVAFMGKWGYELSVKEGQVGVVGLSGQALFVTSSQPGYDTTAIPTGGGGGSGGGGGGGNFGVGVEY